MKPKPTEVFTIHLQALEDVNNREDMLISADLAKAAFKSVGTPQDEQDKYMKAWNRRFSEVKHNHRK